MSSPTQIASYLLSIGSLFLLCPAASALPPVGTTEGYASVSDNGELQYTVPIFTPPGINGLEPELSLVYSHRREESVAGVGWGIAGVSSIDRCPKTLAQNGDSMGVELEQDDRYCLDGNQLRLTSGTYGANGSTYRTEVDLIARITAYGSAGNGPAWFQVESKDGLIYEYGNTADSRILSLAPGYSSTARTWAVSKIRDRHGNDIQFAYYNDGPPLGDYRINTIKYARNIAGGIIVPHYVVDFNYVDHPAGDVDTGYAAGGEVTDEKRLSWIDVYSDSVLTGLVRRYWLTYENALSSTNKSRIEYIGECVGLVGDCLEPLEFSYQDGVPGISTSSVLGGMVPAGARPLVLDINADGRDDFAYPTSSGTWQYRLASASGSYPVSGNTGVSSSSHELALVIDYNTDGFDDVMFPHTGNRWWVMLGGASGLSGAPTDTGTPVEATVPGDALAWDMNADGRDDLVWREGFSPPTPEIQFEQGGRVSVRYREASGFSSQKTTVVEATQALHGIQRLDAIRTGRKHDAPDVNGDGRQDLLIPYTYFDINWGLGIAVMRYQVLTKVSGQFTTIDVWSGDAEVRGVTLDVNGDGYTDAVSVRNGATTLTTRLSTGKGYGASSTGPSATNLDISLAVAFDWDSDGMEDLLVPNTATNTWYWFRSTGTNLNAGINTAISSSSAIAAYRTDSDGDGLDDLVTVNANGSVTVMRHNGPVPDLLDRVTDGFGNATSILYAPLSDSSVYTRYTDAALPAVDYISGMPVVERVTHPDGSGGSFRFDYTYAGMIRDLNGRGLSGFDTRTTTDSRTGNRVIERFSRQFPYRGRRRGTEIRLADNTLFAESTTAYQVLNRGSGYERYYYPYARTTTKRQFEAGGTENGNLISETVTTVTVDQYGSPYDVTERTTEAASANGIHAGAVYDIRTYTAPANMYNNVSTWCLGRPELSTITKSNTASAFGSAITRTTEYDWDNGGDCELNSVTVEPGDARYQNRMTFTYNNFGNIYALSRFAALSPGVRVTQYGWTPEETLVDSVTNPLGQTTTYGWDTIHGDLETITDPNGLTTSIDYDELGRAERVDLPDGTAITYSLSDCSAANSYCGTALANVRASVRTAFLRTDDSEVRYSVDYLDSFSRPVRQSSQRQRSTAAAMVNVDTGYDQFSRPSTTTFPYFAGDPAYSQSVYYDVVGRPTTVERPINEAVSTLQQTRVYYEGLTRRHVDAQGRQSSVVSDVYGSLVRSIDHLGYFVTTDRDAFGSMRQVIDSGSVILDQASVEYGIGPFQVSRNEANRGAWSYSYNGHGELIGYDDANPATIPVVLEYDGLSRLRQLTETEGTTVWTWGTSAALKNIGRLQSLQSPGGKVDSFDYDVYSRLSKETTSVDGRTYTTDYAYNALDGYLDTVTYPGNGFRQAVRYEYAYGDVKTVYDANQSKLLYRINRRDARGNIEDAWNGDQFNIGTTDTKVYDRVTGLLEAQTLYWREMDDIESFDIEYDYDRTGLLKRRKQTDWSVYSGVYRTHEEWINYDWLGRINNGTYSLNGAAPVQHFNYDYYPNGNVRSVVDTDGSFSILSYNSSRPHAVTKIAGNNYQYDQNGNVDDRDGESVSWTSFNKPETIDLAGGSYLRFSYGGDRRRYKKVSGGGSAPTQTTYYAGLTEDREYLWNHVYVDGRMVGAIYGPSTACCDIFKVFHTDHQGSVIAQSSFGFAGARVSYDVFGRSRSGHDWRQIGGIIGSSRDSTRGYTGHEQLDNNGLIHMNGRVYDAEMRRFLSPDPVNGLPGNTQSYNRFSYVLNSPPNYTDPTGYCIERACLTEIQWVLTALSFLGGGSSPPPPNWCAIAGPNGCFGVGRPRSPTSDIYTHPGDENIGGTYGLRGNRNPLILNYMGGVDELERYGVDVSTIPSTPCVECGEIYYFVLSFIPGPGNAIGLYEFYEEPNVVNGIGIVFSAARPLSRIGGWIVRKAGGGAAGKKAGQGVPNKTVGRYMSPDELEKMRTTGRVQEGGGGQTRVADPANPNTYKNPPKGDVYVEFDVPANRVLPHSQGTGRIPGPNSPDARVPGRNPADFEMPKACNITVPGEC